MFPHAKYAGVTSNMYTRAQLYLYVRYTYLRICTRICIFVHIFKYTYINVNISIHVFITYTQQKHAQAKDAFRNTMHIRVQKEEYLNLDRA